MNSCCTITSGNYLSQAIVAIDALRHYMPELDAHILVADEIDLKTQKNKMPNKHWLTVRDLPCEAAVLRYQGNSLRWSLKPFLLLHLLDKYEKVIYIDNDIFTCNKPTELFDRLDEWGIVITPHRRNIKPGTEDFPFIMSDGYFNAGIVGVSNAGLKAVKWWRDACIWNCPDKPLNGLFSDQKYLDTLYIHFHHLCHMLKNPGYNVASWNVSQNPVTSDLLVDNEWPVIMAHLTKYRNPNDTSLQPLYEEYDARVRTESLRLRQDSLEPSPISKEWGVFNQENEGPLNNRLWTKDVAERMLKLYQHGKVQGHKAARGYKIKNIKQVLSANRA